MGNRDLFFVLAATPSSANDDDAFLENRAKLRKLAGDSRYENPKMSKLEDVLLKQFGPSTRSRGILFSKTRKSIYCLYDWVSANEALQDAGVKAAILTGAGNGASFMTQVANSRAPFHSPLPT